MYRGSKESREIGWEQIKQGGSGPNGTGEKDSIQHPATTRQNIPALHQDILEATVMAPSEHWLSWTLLEMTEAWYPPC